MIGCTSRQPESSVRGHSLKAVLLPAHATRRALGFFLAMARGFTAALRVSYERHSYIQK
jgi:hypothetical protein